ncbi:glycoside hydrolase family 76 protein [Rhodococcus maanshanensis]|uniref:Predicted alpha-1,6-mannanase, GH76 family n=1 Tax=Rhodococcus maanshanensis TaxID=183556 RepID=A0A1H7RHV6_9NOCA|nr:glycoside hydrolase family 76 protein [Rhodococcus maanshanensis]SEL59695.1 Predicted alpha-1,6-mannanase, GH76 family [Rhodococcus maanshanensis]
MQHQWAERADAAEEAMVSRHVRRLWALPGTALGVVAWPPVRRERLFFSWHYWWQAHLLDCVVDAALRDPTPKRRRRITKIARAHRVRNIGGWTNNYYDDMAWLGIALERAQRLHHLDYRNAIQDLESELFDAWAPDQGGGIPWCKRSNFYNTPANGPAAIMLARTGRLWRAQAIADWMDEKLRDPFTGLMFDGIRTDGPDSAGELDREIYSYCQGVALGTETELAVRLGAPRHRHRVHALVEAIDKRLTEDGLIVGGGGGDGGLFNGILARYLALVAAELPGDRAADVRARRTAAQIVLDSAEVAWENRLQVEGLPLFGRDWTAPAHLPGLGDGIATFTGGTVRSSDIAERDFSVQLGGWMLMEAAYVASGAL